LWPMIIDLKNFIAEEQNYWSELAAILDKLESKPECRLDLEGLSRFHYLYQRVSADLARIMTFSAEPQIRRYLESLVSRAYSEIHETREKGRRPHFRTWFFQTFPATFRRHFRTFLVVFAITLAGASFGAFAVTADQDARDTLLVFPHLKQTPAERVEKEEAATENQLAGRHASFSSFLITHNIKVSIFALALGMTFGLGTVILLFYNGVLLGAVAADYIAGGQSVFLLGWLLPHGAVEIPAFLLAGQAGLVLAGALIGWGRPLSLGQRLRAVSNDLVTLISGIAVMLVWAGIIEAFFSQFHEPVIPYSLKIAFGMVELLLLIVYLSLPLDMLQGNSYLWKKSTP
jgi:uncharacterized membrane protein SpoIIM required for sporulation